MGQNYKIFYRRHHLVFELNSSDADPDLIVRKINKDLLRAVLSYLKEEKVPQTIYFKEIDAFENFKDCFRIIQAAGGAVFNPNGELLLMKRKGLWDLPKGKLDKGELIVNAAIREVEEECNVFGIDIQQKIGLTYHIYFEKKWLLKETHWYHMISTDWTEARPQIEEDIEEVKWVDPSKLNVNTLDTYLNIRNVLNRLLPL